MDRAGVDYWDRNWTNVPAMQFTPDAPQVWGYRDKLIRDLMLRAFEGLPNGASILEAGCAESAVLPYLGSMGYQISGIDYSSVGCEKFSARLKADGVSGTVECGDIFSPPAHMVGMFDAVISFGLVEHFTDTRSTIAALAAFLKPGGRIFTLVPNMQGITGFVQFLAGPSIYRVHEKVSVNRLADAHTGLRIIDCDYLMPTGFGVVNFYEPAPRALFQARRMMIAALARFSWLTWAIDKRVKLPKFSWLAPFTYCIAEK